MGDGGCWWWLQRSVSSGVGTSCAAAKGTAGFRAFPATLAAQSRDRSELTMLQSAIPDTTLFLALSVPILCVAKGKWSSCRAVIER